MQSLHNKDNLTLYKLTSTKTVLLTASLTPKRSVIITVELPHGGTSNDGGTYFPLTGRKTLFGKGDKVSLSNRVLVF